MGVSVGVRSLYRRRGSVVMPRALIDRVFCPVQVGVQLRKWLVGGDRDIAHQIHLDAEDNTTTIDIAIYHDYICILLFKRQHTNCVKAKALAASN